MKNKFIIVALIAAILVGGMVLVSCANPDCIGDGKCKASNAKSDQDEWCATGKANKDNCLGKGAVVGDKCAC